jgi:hypothetical protein
MLVLANVEATAAFLGLPTLRVNLKSTFKKWLNIILLEESEGKHRSV